MQGVVLLSLVGCAAAFAPSSGRISSRPGKLQFHSYQKKTASSANCLLTNRLSFTSQYWRRSQQRLLFIPSRSHRRYSQKLRWAVSYQAWTKWKYYCIYGIVIRGTPLLTISRSWLEYAAEIIDAIYILCSGVTTAAIQMFLKLRELTHLSSIFHFSTGFDAWRCQFPCACFQISRRWAYCVRESEGCQCLGCGWEQVHRLCVHLGSFYRRSCQWRSPWRTKRDFDQRY